jgi:hypothetical protein
MMYHKNDEGFSVLVLLHASYRVIMPSPLSKDLTCVLRLNPQNSTMHPQRYCFSLSRARSLSYIQTYIHISYIHNLMILLQRLLCCAGEQDESKKVSKDLGVKKSGDLLELRF